MPAKVVLMETDPDLRRTLAAALADAGHPVAAFCNSLAAYDALTNAKTVEVLITCVGCGENQPHGIALGRAGRYRRPSMSVIFLAEADEAEVAQEEGLVMMKPVALRAAVRLVNQIVSS